MQLKDTLASMLEPLEWMGVDLISFIQLLICFVCGLVVKRTWTWSQRSVEAAILRKNKKLEEDLKTKPVDSILKPPLAVDEPVPEKKEQKVQKKAKKQRAKKQEQEQHLKATETGAVEEIIQESAVEESQRKTAYMPESEEQSEKHFQEEHEQNVAESFRAPASEPLIGVSPDVVELDSAMQNDDSADTSATLPLDLPGLANTKDVDSTPSTQVETDLQSESQKYVDSSQSTESQSEAESLPENLQYDPLSLTDHEIQSETEAHGLCQISTPELTPRNISTGGSPSMQWSDMNSLYATEDQPLQEVQPELYIDRALQEVQPLQEIQPEISWVPVAIPVEYLHSANEGMTIHPACFFNGFWQNSRQETIMIEGSELKFDNGPVWVMKEHTLNGFSVEVGGDVYHAEVALGGQQLLWSDGDIWTCIGRLQHDASPVWFQDQSELDTIMMPAEGYMPPSSDTACVDNMPTMLVAAPQANVEHDMEDDWEECWDWKKKGWCYRGEKCEWKHSCRTPLTWRADGPFVEDEPTGLFYSNAVGVNDSILCEVCA